MVGIDKLEFMALFEQLCDAFGSVKKKERAEVYWQELQGVDPAVLAQAIRRLNRQGERFPPISQILGTVESIAPRNNGNPGLPTKDEVRLSWKSLSNEDFRSKLIAYLNGLMAKGKNPMDFARGFLETRWVVEKNDPEKRKIAEEVISEVVGADRFAQIAEKRHQESIFNGRVRGRLGMAAKIA